MSTGFLLKSKFVRDTSILENTKLSVLTVAIRLPDGNIETIENRGEGIKPKIEYYMKNYDENFCLLHNPNIQIIGYMLV
jgi:hypothetical protein